ncbi:MAG: beta-N-acetylhexosaminidase [Gammaproteobacteria bacterium]
MSRNNTRLPGPLFIDIDGVELTAEDRDILRHPLVGGVIYFRRNFISREQITRLTQEIKALRSPELLIAVDHEGGRVQRFRDGFTVLPPVNTIGQLYAQEPQRCLDYAYQHGWLMAAELREVGIDFSFAPVLDLDYARSEVIGDRAFHASPQAVAQIAQYYIRGMNAAGMAASGKHFPGHGWAVEDSHVAIPSDARDLETILQQDVMPYRRLLGHGLAAVMPAHVIYTQVDTLPACFSQHWLQQILRRELGFDGLIISDDLSMQGAVVVSPDIVERAHVALEAGCEMLLLCNDRSAVMATLDTLHYQGSALAQRRMAAMRATPNNAVAIADLRSSAAWHSARRVLEELG